ncbi:hypothetical protein [Candidatus Protochlamydia phocaeensis]|uniref:hypothetical protein n=1 Tax=Candidatus Protochlamydia phocaeensis TaxID=1414722 RepID=UPI000838FACB|nr:hypothetical protein [Candidatus Protochlamydia phocaeensis]
MVKKWILSSLLAGLLSFYSLSAMSMGRSGESFVAGDTLWQPVQYEDERNQLVALIPGEPSCGICNGLSFIYSFYREVNYEIHLKPSVSFVLPETVQEFVDCFREIPNAQIYVLEPAQPTVRYMLEIHLFDQAKTTLKALCRLYATNNTIYSAIVEGEDFSLAYEFFNSIKIEQ